MTVFFLLVPVVIGRVGQRTKTRQADVAEEEALFAVFCRCRLESDPIQVTHCMFSSRKLTRHHPLLFAHTRNSASNDDNDKVSQHQKLAFFLFKRS